MNRYVRVDRGSGSRAGQLLRHHTDPNRWQVRVFLGRDASGKKVRVSEVVIGKKRDAEARLTELLQSRNQGTLRPTSKATLNTLTSEWLAYKAHGVSARTLDSYRNALKLYVLPALGHMRIADVTLRDVEKLYAGMRSGTLPDAARAAGWRGEPLGARSVQITHTALSQALSQAVRWGMIPHNPISEAQVPVPRAREKRALTVTERKALLDVAENIEAFHRVLYRVLVDIGIRPGEACALKWDDIDFAGDRISITKTITRGKNRTKVVAPPKTTKSSRTIPMFGLHNVLLDHRRWQINLGLDESGYVFTNQDGGLLAPWVMNTRELQRVLAAAGITDFSLYGFRHTFATLHLQSGTPLKVVSEWLGHSTIQHTANTYQHLSEDVSRDYAERHLQWLRAETAAIMSVKAN